GAKTPGRAGGTCRARPLGRARAQDRRGREAGAPGRAAARPRQGRAGATRRARAGDPQGRAGARRAAHAPPGGAGAPHRLRPERSGPRPRRGARRRAAASDSVTGAVDRSGSRARRGSQVPTQQHARRPAAQEAALEPPAALVSSAVARRAQGEMRARRRFAMSTYASSVDPPDLGMLPTFRRLLRLWREQWKLGLFGLTCALAYTLISIMIPILIQRAIDNAIVPHNEDQLPPYLAAIGGLALLRFGINFNRRYATARIGIRIEARMRELLYQAYLRYPRAFYDRHATGQVLSRATNDLYPIRYFIGWGLVQGMQSVMMIIGAGIVL